MVSPIYEYSFICIPKHQTSIHKINYFMYRKQSQILYQCTWAPAVTVKESLHFYVLYSKLLCYKFIIIFILTVGIPNSPTPLEKKNSTSAHARERLNWFLTGIVSVWIVVIVKRIFTSLLDYMDDDADKIQRKFKECVVHCFTNIINSLLDEVKVLSYVQFC